MLLFTPGGFFLGLKNVPLFEILFLLHYRKVTILVVGLDKAGKTCAIRGMSKGKIKQI